MIKIIVTLFLIGFPRLFFAQTHFIDIALEKGIDHSYGQGFSGGGVSFCDFNNDGWDDLTVATQSGDLLHFYKNLGGTFEKISSLITDTFEVKQVIWVDYDNDGDKDLYLTNNNGPNRLFSNNGQLYLTDVTAAVGLPLDVLASYGACWGDVDRDGWLDLYFTKRAVDFTTNRAWLYRNRGDGTFEDISNYSMTVDADKAAFMPAFLDINNDLWQDIYVAQDKSQINSLFRNNGDLTFSEIGHISNSNEQMNAMCVTPGDYDNDGDLDIYITNTEDGNKLLRNTGFESFIELANIAGVGFNGTGWGANFLDADNDGDLDLYVSGSGIGADVISSNFYQNIGFGFFDEPFAGFVGDTVSSYGNAVGDFNKDGLPDIFVNNTFPFPSHLWGNITGNKNNFLKINLIGVESNRDAIGTWIKIFINGQIQTRYIHGGIGYLGQNSLTQIFGLGNAETIDSLQVKWLTGHVDRLYDVACNQTILIEEGSSTNGNIYVDPEIDNAIIISVTYEEGDTSVMLFPNPSNGAVKVISKSFFFRKLGIFDLSGDTILEKKMATPQQEITLTFTLSPGIYLIRFEDTKGIQHFKKWMVF